MPDKRVFAQQVTVAADPVTVTFPIVNTEVPVGVQAGWTDNGAQYIANEFIYQLRIVKNIDSISVTIAPRTSYPSVNMWVLLTVISP